ncbi:sigma-70 family RNA polymerase sigma factor [Microtetraspora sp. NBRC 16547]|uniref:sigma-70 family RNA polymerase sigma factor n=1 Tax=Microtetraspora sp. NBRC 16547 TaxID=3030993 RepID=UPI0024A42691|nr:sigma-70 family RNA polymerase sigma factor [Microtetraspora sp. NBRC 16547]GLX00028.1 RNA polymerase sigma factor [Microtetraspora sp. NBRC 16547]
MGAGDEDDDDAVVAAARAGHESAFAALVERHRGELRVHCYRMLGSFDESEDLVQETFLRAWKNLGGFEGRSTLRAWLYRIATNACLDALDGRARRGLPHHLSAPSDPSATLPPRTDIAWLQPFPDRLWEPVAPSEAEPDAVVVGRETIELAFLAAIQHLPPKQRAVLILRDVLGWPAKQTAAVLEGSLASVNSALQRARATLREHLPERRLEWAPSAEPTEQELAVLRRYMDAVERADLAAVAALLAEDVRTTMPPYPMWFQGRDTVVAALAASWDPDLPGYVGRFRMMPTRANGRPAMAGYVRRPGDAAYRAFAIGVPRIEDGRIVEITAFHDAGLFPAFALATVLPPAQR